MKEILNELQKIENNLDDNLKRIKTLISDIQLFLIQKHNIHIASFDLTIGSWKCKNSPIGICFYNRFDDPALDECLICGYPHERK